MTEEMFQWSLEGSRDPVTQKLNNKLILPRSFMLPKNSNIQLVYPDVMNSIARAKRFKPPLREYLLELAENHLAGILSISSEQGAFLREFNTTRGAASMGQVVGQPVTWWDEYVLGKEKTKNNPKAAGGMIGNF